MPHLTFFSKGMLQNRIEVACNCHTNVCTHTKLSKTQVSRQARRKTELRPPLEAIPQHCDTVRNKCRESTQLVRVLSCCGASHVIPKTSKNKSNLTRRPRFHLRRLRGCRRRRGTSSRSSPPSPFQDCNVCHGTPWLPPPQHRHGAAQENDQHQRTIYTTAQYTTCV